MLRAVLKNAASPTAAAWTLKDGTLWKCPGLCCPVCLSQAAEFMCPGLWSSCLPITCLRVHNHYVIILGRYVSILYLPLLVQALSSKTSFTRPQRCQLENIGGFVNVKTYSLNIYECWGVLLQMSKDSLYFLVQLTLLAVSMWTFLICTSRFMFVWRELNSHQSLCQYFNPWVVSVVPGKIPLTSIHYKTNPISGAGEKAQG